MIYYKNIPLQYIHYICLLPFYLIKTYILQYINLTFEKKLTKKNYKKEKELYLNYQKQMVKMNKPIICILTGPCGAGKTTISKGLSQHIDRTAYLEVDTLRHMLGKNEVDYSTYTKEVKKQINLSMDNAISIGKNFIKNGFNVIIDDVLEDTNQIEYYNKGLKGYKLFIFLLLPNKKVIEKRDKERKENAMNERALQLHDIFSKISNHDGWYVIDSSKHKVEDTIKEILKIIKTN